MKLLLMLPKRLDLSAGLLIAMVWIAYVPALSLGFVDYDDNFYVSKNPVVREGLSQSSLYYAFTTFDSGNWIPVVWLSYLVDATLFGIHPVAFHAVNLILHTINCVLLLIWLRRWTGQSECSLAAAILFALHPMHVESVAWVAERKDLLSLLFFLCMLIAYECYVQRPHGLTYCAVLLLYGLGLMSKSMLVTAPFVLWLIDLWPASGWSSTNQTSAVPVPRAAWMIAVEKIPMLVMALIVGMVTICAQGAGEVTAFTSWETIPPGYRLGNALTAYAWYLGKTLLPTGLCVMYSHPMKRLSILQAIAAGILLLFVSLYVLRNARTKGFLSFGWLWFVITLLPVIGLLQVGTQAHADRYSYLPQIGLWIALVWQVDEWIKTIESTGRVRIAIVATLAIAFTVLTIKQVSYWKDTETLWQRALAVSAQNWEAHRQFGMHCRDNGQLTEAQYHFQQAIIWNPNLPDMYANLGWIEQQQENWDAAQKQYEHALSITGGNEFALSNLMQVLKRQQRITDAIPWLGRYLRHHPEDVKFRNELGLIYARQGDIIAASREFQNALQIDPENLSSLTNLGLCLSRLNRLPEAREYLERVVSHDPMNANARVNLAVLLEELGLREEARQQLKTAVDLNPDDAEAKERLYRMSRN